VYDIQKEALQIVNDCEEAALRDEIKVAVLMAQGTDREILDIEEDPNFDARIFPPGTRRFFVESEHSLEGRERMCFHCDVVYRSAACIVVLNQKAMRTMSMRRLISLLNGDPGDNSGVAP
jgi:hypothetical protein